MLQMHKKIVFLIGILIYSTLVLSACKRAPKKRKIIVNIKEEESEKIKILKKIQKIEPNVDEHCINIAVQYIKEKNHSHAIKWLAKIEEKNSENFDVIYYLALANQLRHKSKIALEYYEKALKINENHHRVLLNMGILYYELYDYKKSSKYLFKGLLFCKNESEKIEPYWFIASIYYKENKPKKALKYYKMFYSLTKTRKLKIKFENKIKDAKKKMRILVKQINRGY